jgi:hypothetical protein
MFNGKVISLRTLKSGENTVVLSIPKDQGPAALGMLEQEVCVQSAQIKVNEGTDKEELLKDILVSLEIIQNRVEQELPEYITRNSCKLTAILPGKPAGDVDPGQTLKEGGYIDHE